MANATLLQRTGGTISTAAATTDTSASWPIIPNEDSLLLSYFSADKSAGTITAPTGWTEVHQHVSTDVSGGFFYKVAGASESRQVVMPTGTHDTSPYFKIFIMEEWAGLEETTPLDQAAEANSTTNTQSTGTTATLTDANSWAAAFWVRDTGEAKGAFSISTAGWTVGHDYDSHHINHNPGHYTGYRDVSGTTGQSATTAFSGSPTTDQMWGSIAVFHLQDTTYVQDVYRFFDDDGALAKYDQTLPVIQSGDVTANNGTGTTITANTPAYVAGDLLISFVAHDDDDNLRPPTGTGPGGETLHLIGAEENGNTAGPNIGGCWWIGGSTQGASSISWNVQNSEEWATQTVKVLAAEVDGNNPIGASSTGFSNNAGTDLTTPHVIIPHKGGRLLLAGATDTDQNVTASTGYTVVQETDQSAGGLSIVTVVRDAATSNLEDVAADTTYATHVDSVTNNSIAVVVMGNRTESGATASAAESTSADLDTDTNYRVRARVSNRGQDGTTTFKWQYKHTEGTNTWTDVGASTVVQYANTTQYTNGADVEEMFFTNGRGVFVDDNNAAMDNANAITLTSALAPGRAFETELCFQIDSAQVSDNDNIQFRVIDSAATATWEYDVTIACTVNEASANQEFTGTVTFDKHAINATLAMWYTASSSLAFDKHAYNASGQHSHASSSMTFDKHAFDATVAMWYTAASSLTLGTTAISATAQMWYTASSSLTLAAMILNASGQHQYASSGLTFDNHAINATAEMWITITAALSLATKAIDASVSQDAATFEASSIMTFDKHSFVANAYRFARRTLFCYTLVRGYTRPLLKPLTDDET